MRFIQFSYKPDIYDKLQFILASIYDKVNKS